MHQELVNRISTDGQELQSTKISLSAHTHPLIYIRQLIMSTDLMGHRTWFCAAHEKHFRQRPFMAIGKVGR